MTCPIKVRSIIVLTNQRGAKNDPPNNSCDKIGTYLEIANYTRLVAFSVQWTLLSLVDFLLPTSSIQLQSSGQDLAVGGSEAAYLRTPKLFTWVHLWPGFSVRHCVKMC